MRRTTLTTWFGAALLVCATALAGGCGSDGGGAGGSEGGGPPGTGGEPPGPVECDYWGDTWPEEGDACAHPGDICDIPCSGCGHVCGEDHIWHYTCWTSAARAPLGACDGS